MASRCVTAKKEALRSFVHGLLEEGALARVPTKAFCMEGKAGRD
jgi:hypothetical protein